MKHSNDKYEKFVAHPRYGNSPQFTGLNPDGRTGSDAYMHWHSPKDCRIPNTAIAADRCKQNSGLGYVTHYFDVARCCIDCDRMFIFFAEEQRYWYEVLKFNLGANCVRCVECRKMRHGVESLRHRYEQLLNASARSDKEALELAKCCITLIERSVFGMRAFHVVR
jgi:Probable zinc-ribbon domain